MKQGNPEQSWKEQDPSFLNINFRRYPACVRPCTFVSANSCYACMLNPIDHCRSDSSRIMTKQYPCHAPTKRSNCATFCCVAMFYNVVLRLYAYYWDDTCRQTTSFWRGTPGPLDYVSRGVAKIWTGIHDW